MKHYGSRLYLHFAKREVPGKLSRAYSVSLGNNLFAGGTDIILFPFCFGPLALKPTSSVTFLRTSVEVCDALLVFSDASQRSELCVECAAHAHTECALLQLILYSYYLPHSENWLSEQRSRFTHLCIFRAQHDTLHIVGPQGMPFLMK